MSYSRSQKQAFSLMEVVITIGVISFAFVGLLGLFPVALEQSRSCVNETRGAQLARMVFSTLTSESFTSAECFGDSSGGSLDLSTLDASSPPAILYASYDGTGQVTIVRTDKAPTDATYRIEMHFDLVPSVSSSPTGAPTGNAAPKIRGNNVRLLITGGSLGKTIAFQGVDFINGLQRVASIQ